MEDEDKLALYNKVREVPKTAQTPITDGKLKGKTDINPMWRIKKLTEVFGICGIGWKTEIKDMWIDEVAKGEKIANVKILLYIKDEKTDKWSDGIEGIGGSLLVQECTNKTSQEKYFSNNDDAYKMAYTDAISVACKQLGIGADVYWDKDKTKYSYTPQEEPSSPKVESKTEKKTEEPKKAEEEKRDFNEVLFDMFKKGNFINIEPKEVNDLIKKKDWFDREIAVNDMTQPQFRRLLVLLGKENEMRAEPF